MEIKLGPLIKEAIALNNITQKEAARKLNISPQSLSMYVNNHRMPDIASFISMINTLDINLGMLIKMRDIFSTNSKDVLLMYAIREMNDNEKELLFMISTLIRKLNK